LREWTNEEMETVWDRFQSSLLESIVRRVYRWRTWADVSWPARPAINRPQFTGLSAALDAPVRYG
jgi:hypothetical protein